MNAASSTSPTAAVRDVADPAPDLARVIELLGPRLVTPLGAAPSERVVTGVEFYEPSEELPDQVGTILLVPSGAAHPAGGLAELIDVAVELRYAALAVKCDAADLPELDRRAAAAGLPLLRVAGGIGWRLLDAQLARLLGEQRRAEDAHLDRGVEPLFALANELAAFFGGSVAIEDLGRRIVAYSSVPGQLIDAVRTQGILERRVPDSPDNASQYREVIRAAAPIKFPERHGELARVAFAIRAGALPLGTIWAIDGRGDAPLAEEQALRLRSAASVAAAHLLDDIRLRETGQVPREEQVRALLDGSGVTGSELIGLGIAEERGARLLVFDPGREEHPTTLARLRSTIQRHLALHRPETVAVLRRGRVYALITHEDQDRLERALEALLPVLDHLVSGEIAVALTDTTHRAVGVAQLRETADRLLAAARRSPGTGDRGNRVLTVDRLRPLLLLERLRALAEAEPSLRDPRLARMQAEHPALAEAVLHWCAASGGIARTAESLGVHANTVRYRLRRAEEHSALDLGDPDARLAAWLQLRLDA